MNRAPGQKNYREVAVIAMAVSGGFDCIPILNSCKAIPPVHSVYRTVGLHLQAILLTQFFSMFRLYKIWLQVYWVTEGCVTIISYHRPFSDANIFAFSCYILNQMEDDGVPMPASSSSFSRPQTYIIFLEIMEYHLLFWSIPHRDRNYHATVTLNPRKAQSSSKRKRRCSPVSRARWQANAQ